MKAPAAPFSPISPLRHLIANGIVMFLQFLCTVTCLGLIFSLFLEQQAIFELSTPTNVETADATHTGWEHFAYADEYFVCVQISVLFLMLSSVVTYIFRAVRLGFIPKANLVEGVTDVLAVFLLVSAAVEDLAMAAEILAFTRAVALERPDLSLEDALSLHQTIENLHGTRVAAGIVSLLNAALFAASFSLGRWGLTIEEHEANLKLSGAEKQDSLF